MCGFLIQFLVLTAAATSGCSRHEGVPWAWQAWNDPLPPFHIAGNIHHVGSRNMGVFLITTPDGHILLDSAFDATVPQIRVNMKALGFRFEDIKILLSSHAHVDHVQGHAQVRKLTGARVLASQEDAPIISSGGKGDFLFEDLYAWQGCPVDGIVKDGDVVELGGTKLVARLTPGHTKGATTWTMKVQDGGKTLDVVFFPSGNVNAGVRLVGNPRYPGIAADFDRSFATWKSLPCDVFLGAHGVFWDAEGKLARVRAGGPNPFIDPEGYKKVVAQQEAAFRAKLHGANEIGSATAKALATGMVLTRRPAASSTTSTSPSRR